MSARIQSRVAWYWAAAALLFLVACKDDGPEASDTGTGSSSGGESTSGPPPMSDSTGTLPPCETGLQPHGQCLLPIEFGDDPIQELRVGVFTTDGRESVATQAVQDLSLGRLFADDAGELVLQTGEALELSSPWEIVVGRFHADADVEELLYAEPDFESFHFFRAGDSGFELVAEEPFTGMTLGTALVSFDGDGSGVAEVYEVVFTGTPTARLIATDAGSWGPVENYEYAGGPIGDAGIVLDSDQDGIDELVVSLAGNLSGEYDPGTHQLRSYSALGPMLVVEGTVPAGDKPFYMDAGDFDGDGFADVLVKGDDVGVLLSSPEGLGEHNSLMLMGGVATRARACDVDGDGIHEVVTQPGQTGGAMLLWANVLTADIAIETIADVTMPQELECPDLDGDGRDEIVFRDEEVLRVLRPLETL